MGMNYYWIGKCRDCGHLQKRHIGKSSCGWYFSLHVIPGVIDTLADWRLRFADEGSFIHDEYGNAITAQAMLEGITQRSGPPTSPPDHSADRLARNYAEVGVNNLLRYVVGEACCVGHGEGTWSYVTGEFS
ncbi:MAG: hypothetical protein DRJ03_02025 [Chloroflexi bacterium]|nr:MAG: hypothetical protein DRJ03_02025 [Chloroflexota bacterium]